MKPEIVEELARAIAIEDGTSPNEPVAPYDKRLGWELYKGSVRAIAPIIDRLVSEAREEGRRAARIALSYPPASCTGKVIWPPETDHA